MDIALRAVFLYVFVVFLLRVMGRRELSSLSAIDLVLLIAVAARRARRVLEGEPVVIIEGGKLIERNLKRERLTEDEIAEEMRMQQIASVDDVEWGILESSGNMSFISK